MTSMTSSVGFESAYLPASKDEFGARRTVNSYTLLPAPHPGKNRNKLHPLIPFQDLPFSANSGLSVVQMGGQKHKHD